MTAVQAGSGGSVQDLSFVYDALSNVTSRTDAVQSVTETFTPEAAGDPLYDAYNRIASSSIAGFTTKTFQYNAVLGSSPRTNITSKSDVGTYTYNPPGSALPHAVQSVTGSLNATYTEPALGRAEARPEGRHPRVDARGPT